MPPYYITVICDTVGHDYTTTGDPEKENYVRRCSRCGVVQEWTGSKWVTVNSKGARNEQDRLRRS